MVGELVNTELSLSPYFTIFLNSSIRVLTNLKTAVTAV